MKSILGVSGVALFLLAGCMGKYEVGTESEGGAGTGGGDTETGGTHSGGTAATSGGVGKANGGKASGGAPSEGGSVGKASGGVATGGGGAVGGTGKGGGVGPNCVFPVSGPLPETGFESSDVVYERLVAFVAPSPTPYPAPIDLPPSPSTRREWAGAVALELLESQEVPWGLHRFLSTWYLGVSQQAWALSWLPAVSAPNWSFAGLIEARGDTEPSAGILTDHTILTGNAGPSGRGAWVLSNFLCMPVPPPPANLTDPLPEPSPGVTRRQALESFTADPVCAGCHRLIDPLGFAFENFDELGNYRVIDNGAPVDASGDFTSQYGSHFVFTSVFDLAPQLMASCEVARCMAQRMTQDALNAAGLGSRTPSDDEINYIANRFASSGLSTKVLVREIAMTPSFLR